MPPKVQHSDDNETTQVMVSVGSTIEFNLIDAKELYECNLPPISYLIPKYVCESSLIYYSGSPGTFKTAITLDIAISGALGLPFLDVDIEETFNTLFIDEENGRRRTKSKLKRLVNGMGIDIKELEHKVTFATISGFKLNFAWVARLKEYIEEFKPKLIVIDNIARCLVGSEQTADDVSIIHSLLKPLIEYYGVSFIIIHHLVKAEFGKIKSLNDIRGSGDFGGQCDEAFLLEKYKIIDDISQIFRLKQLKIKDGQEFGEINFKVSGDIRTDPPSPLIVEFDGYVLDKKANKLVTVYKDIIQFFEDENINKMKTQKIKDIMKEKHEHSKYYVDKALKQLVDDRILTDKPYGYYEVLK